MQIGQRIASWFGGKKLPYDAEVEYLTMSDGAYLDTMLLYNNTISKIELRFIAYGILGREVAICGASSPYFVLYAVDSIAKIELRKRAHTNKVSLYVSTLNLGEEAVAVIEGINGNKIVGHGGVPNAMQHILIGVITNYLYPSGDLSSIKANNDNSVKYFGYTAYIENEVVVDCIPVRKDGVGYMYDKISGQFFGNAGTGAFIIGPDKSANGGGYKCLVRFVKSLVASFSSLSRYLRKEVAR